MKTAISNPYKLLDTVGVSKEALGFEVDLDSTFALRAPRPFIDKMRLGDPKDPLLLQVLTQAKENIEFHGFVADPLAERDSLIPGLLHKYRGRVLLVATSACAINCRYCFRRHFPYQDKLATGKQLEQAIDYIGSDKTISEVILSGGDPLVLDDSAIRKLIIKIESVSHVQRLRIHTRLPIVIPQRLTSQLRSLLSETRLQTSIVLHINHANEVDELLDSALRPFRCAGIQLLNQSVLLKNINDDRQTLMDLSEKLFSVGVLPYYLHLLDRVAGAAHFEVTETKAKMLIDDLRNNLPGYLVPRLAREQAGSASKTVIS